MFDFIKVLFKNIAKGPATQPFPAGEAYTPPRFRGRVNMDPSLCVGCAICHHVCAGGAIQVHDREEKSGYDFTLWHNSCALCGMCSHYCPTGAISMTTDWHNAHRQEKKYEWAEHHFVPYVPCAGCGKPMRRLPPHLAMRIYAHTPIDMTDIIKLCPECRQKAAVQREQELLEYEKAHNSTGETPPEAALASAASPPESTQVPKPSPEPLPEHSPEQVAPLKTGEEDGRK